MASIIVSKFEEPFLLESLQKASRKHQLSGAGTKAFLVKMCLLMDKPKHLGALLEELPRPYLIDFGSSDIPADLLDVFKPLKNLGPKVKIKGFQSLHDSLTSLNTQQDLLKLAFSSSSDCLSLLFEAGNIPATWLLSQLRGETVLHRIVRSHPRIEVLSKCLRCIAAELKNEQEIKAFVGLKNSEGMSALELCQVQ